MIPAAVEIDNLHVSFEGRELFAGFSLAAAPGEKIVITGPSGTGKSTLLAALLGFAAPAAGAVRIDGEPPTAHSVWRLRRRIAYVAQEPELGTGAVREVVERPFHYRANADLRPNLERLPDLLARFGLPEATLDKDISLLSGGEKQRVGIIQALLLDRPILLLDEISSALDPQNKQPVIETLRATDQTVLLITHDPDLLAVADRVIDLADAARRTQP